MKRGNPFGNPFSNPFLHQFSVTHPIVQAPMGGGPATPELVAAVSNAGGLGSLAGGYLAPAAILESAQRIRAQTSRPFAINLFVGDHASRDAYDPRPMLDILEEIHALLGIPRPELPVPSPGTYPEQFEAALEAAPAVISFTFGVPGHEHLARCRRRGILTVGTATTPEEAGILAGAGVNAIVAQGAEAGAHRGTFHGEFAKAMIPTLSLVHQIASTLDLPVIASGGIMRGQEIAQAQRAGASAAQLGTAFLPCPESGASDTYKAAILSATGDRTVVTRAFSGRPARGIRNRFISLMEEHQDAILPYPLQNAFTRAMRQAAAEAGDRNYLSLWAGTGVANARELPAGVLVRTLAVEMETSAPPPD